MIELQRVYEHSRGTVLASWLNGCGLAGSGKNPCTSAIGSRTSRPAMRCAAGSSTTRSVGGVPTALPDRARSAYGRVEANSGAARAGDVTLLYSSHDTEHNNAVVLRDYLNERLGQR
jgi:hypothetical protein